MFFLSYIGILVLFIIFALNTCLHMYKTLHTGKEEKKYQVKLVPLEAINERKDFGLIHKNKSSLIASNFKSMTTL